MDINKKNAIYDAINKITGLDGVWEDQKGVRLSGAHFSMKLLFPANNWERKGNLISKENEKERLLTRHTSTLQVKIFGDESASDKMARANNNTNWHKYLNAGDVVCLGMIGSADISRIYTEYENVYLYDFTITWCEEDYIQPDVVTDDVIERVEITATVDDIEWVMWIPDDDIYDVY